MPFLTSFAGQRRCSRFVGLMFAALAAIVFYASPSSAGSPYRVVDTIRLPDDGGGLDYIKLDPIHDRILIGRDASAISVDLASHRVTTLARLSNGHAALPLLDGRHVLLTDSGSNQAILIDVAGKRVASFPVRDPDGAWQAGLDRALITAAGSITVIDTKKRRILGVVRVRGDVEEPAIEGDRAWVAVADRHEIDVVDLKKFKVVSRFALDASLCGNPHGIVRVRGGGLVVTCDTTSSAVLVSASTGRILDSMSISDPNRWGRGFVDGIAYDEVANTVFLPAGGGRAGDADRGVLAVVAILPTRLKVLQRIAMPAGADQVAYSAARAQLYVKGEDLKIKYRGPANSHVAVVPGSYRIVVLGRRMIPEPLTTP